VLVGDVWICSGQSNMEFWLGGASDAAEVIPKASDPLLRLFSVASRTSIKPEKDVALALAGKGAWQAASPSAVEKFTAVGYYFGRALRADLGIPIGLIDSCAGGSKAQLWLSVDAIAKHTDLDPEFSGWLAQRDALIADYANRATAYAPLKAKFDRDTKHYFDEVETEPAFVAKKKAWEEESARAIADGKAAPPRPVGSEPRPKAPEPPDGGQYGAFMVGNLYHAMIAPLMPYAIKGVIWYQGESNDDHAKQYRALFPLLIDDCREKWGQGDFPFLFVQLPNIAAPATRPVQDDGRERWAAMREAQAQALHRKTTGMAVTIDVGDPWNVHGKDKYDVGERLSLVARHLVYGEEIVWTGPTYDSMQVDGSRISIKFANTAGGLMIGSPLWTVSGKIPPVADHLNGFAIAGEDRKWYWGTAQIDHDGVIISSDQVPHPVAVRYGWANNPPCSLYNSAHLPAAPFRTDDW
jgi:sialate O-acetylesterase